MVSIMPGRPTRRWLTSPVSHTRPRSISSATRLETVALVSPVDAATTAREQGALVRIVRSTMPRLVSLTAWNPAGPSVAPTMRRLPSRSTPSTAFLRVFPPVSWLPPRRGLTTNSFKHKTNRCPAVPPKRGSMPLVAGVDSSTQATKIVVRDADTGALVRQARAPHPDGTEVNPQAWWQALLQAASGGLLDDVAALSVAAQQHGMVALDADAVPVRDALLWNDTRSAGAASDLIAELGGPAEWSRAVGSVPVASFTVTKLRWLAQHEPGNAARAESILLPHDWLTQRLTGAAEPVTDRGDASGTGYYDPATGAYRTDLLTLAFGRELRTPRVAGPAETVGEVRAPGLPSIGVVGVGTGDNMAAALALDARPGDVVVSVGTSGTAFAVAEKPTADPSGAV